MSDYCLLCHRDVQNSAELGRLYKKTKVAISAHYHCLVFSSQMHQRGKPNNGIKGFLTRDIRDLVNRTKQQKCMFCGLGTANIRCSHPAGCERTFHLPCGLDNAVLHQFFGDFKSFCPKHRPRQEVALSAILPEHCSICLQGWSKSRKHIQERGLGPCVAVEKSAPRPAKRRDKDEILWAPCCKFTTAFHRQCVKRLAETSGYFFKCPCCCNQEIFTQTMRNLGIYVPNEDPAWHLEREAIEEMTRPTKISCTASPCLSPYGANYQRKNTVWEMTKCSLCAAEGVHKSCGKLNSSLDTWQCSSCSVVVTPVDFTDTLISTRQSKEVSKRKMDAPSTSNMTKLGVPCKQRATLSSYRASATCSSASATITSGESCAMSSHGATTTCSESEARTSSDDKHLINRILLASVFKLGQSGVQEIYSSECGMLALCEEKHRHDEPWI